MPSIPATMIFYAAHVAATRFILVASLAEAAHASALTLLLL